MGVGLSILIGVGIYEAIQHRHEIQERCTRRTHRHDNTANQFDQNSKRDEPWLSDEKTKDFPGIKPLTHDTKPAKKRRSLIPRFRSKPGKGAVSEAVDPVQIDRGSISGPSRCEDHYADEELPLAPPPPYASLLTEEVFPDS